MQIRTEGGATYSIEYREVSGYGRVLVILRHGGRDDALDAARPMVADQWYRVDFLTPLPPQVGSRVAMMLDPIEGADEAVTRFSSPVIEASGTLED